jgi:hypothetical protein
VGISILQPKLLGKWLLVFGILTTAACSAPPQSDFNPSAGAVHLKEEYGFDPAMAAATNDLPLQMPRSMRTDLDEQRWKVPPSLSWVQLRDKHFSEQGSGSLRTVWRYDGEIWWWEQPPVLFTWTFPPITTSPC